MKWILDVESSRRKFWPAPVLDLPEAATPSANVSGLDRSCFVGPSYLEEPTFSASTWMFGPGESTTTQRVPYRPTIVPHNPDSPELHITTQDTVYIDAGAKEPLPFDSLYGSVPRPPQVSRLDLLQAWRMRMGLASSAPGPSAGQAMARTRPCGARGGLLPLSILERIVRDLLDMAAPDTHPRRVLAPLAMASKRLRSIAAPFIYDHVEIRNKEDREIYARAGATKYVRRLTIYFDPHDRCNPRGALMDSGLCAPYFAPQGGSEGGIAYHFPQCYEVRLVAKCVSEELPPAQRVDLIPTLSYRIPTTASRVVLETDLADLSAEFAFHIMMREGFVNPNVEIEIHTNRDEVVRSVERIIQSRVSRWADPVLLQKRIILRGPTYGTDIFWDESMGLEPRITQRMWQVPPTRPNGHPNQVECRAQPTQEDEDEDEVLGVHEAMAEISRRNASSAKQTLATTTQSPPRKSSRRRGKKSSKALHVSSSRSNMPPPKSKPLASTAQYPPFLSEGGSSGRTTLIGGPNEATFEHIPRTRQTPARHAGKLAAEEPSSVEKMVEELEKEDQAHQDSCSCCHGRTPKVVGVQGPIAKAELNVFVGTYYARLCAARCRMTKFARMRKLQQKKEKAKLGSSKQGGSERDDDIAQGAAKGPARKRARRA
ncbi:hypothetical protein FS749_005441 [Ceratobasidium sp. UAMH 11750]|nr:hypothetical protein FS749_005441 [Ceratobasidium sp. UAMH 11750]